LAVLKLAVLILGVGTGQIEFFEFHYWAFFFKVFILNYAQYNVKIDPKSFTYTFFYCECVDEVFNYPNLKLLIQIFLKTISKCLYYNETKRKRNKNMIKINSIT
jgi:hypothetical protein